MRYGPAYYNAGQLQTVLATIVHAKETPARDVAQCTRAWVELEKLKREMRGIPPLKPMSLNDLLLKRARRASAITDAVETPAAPAPVESEAKESL